MELHTHICSRCNAEYNVGNATLIPDGWQWHGGKLICGDCNTAASFMAHSSADDQRTHDATSAIDDEPAARPNLTTHCASDKSGRNIASWKGAKGQRLWQVDIERHTDKGVTNTECIVAAAHCVAALWIIPARDPITMAEIVAISIKPASTMAQQAQNERIAA
jgi:hypothetical protein